jgi:hypothetical protein
MSTFTGQMPQRTFAGREGLDLSREKGAGNEEAGLLADSIKLFGMFTADPTAGKVVVCNDAGQIPNEAIPPAAGTQLGGIIPGNGLLMNNGVLSVAGAATSNLVANNGFRKYEDGFMEQWGFVNLGSQTVTLVFPQTFVELFVMNNDYVIDAVDQQNSYSPKIRSKSNSQVTIWVNAPFFWRAIGRWK